MNILARLAAALLGFSLVVSLAPAADAYQPTITGTVKCMPGPDSYGQTGTPESAARAVIVWTITDPRTILTASNPDANGLAGPFTITEEAYEPGHREFWVEYTGNTFVDDAGDVTVPDCDGPGYDKPAPRVFVQTKRHCKSKAVVKRRTVHVGHKIHTDRLGSESWETVVRRSDWRRVSPTPRGCVLRHREWVRNHGGRR